jgi:hypothetical protein
MTLTVCASRILIFMVSRKENTKHETYLLPAEILHPNARFQGNIPKSLEGLKNLAELELQGNLLTGRPDIVFWNSPDQS